jgi:sialic acid synthase SpsE
MLINTHNTDEKVFIIAEIGNNHEGDFERAKDMILAAQETGVDAVKFQTIVPEKLVSKNDSKRIEQLTKFQFSYEQFEELAEICKKVSLTFISTPFDLDSVTALDKFMSVFKIASGDNEFIPLIKKIAQTGKPIIMSTGLADYELLNNVVDLILRTWRLESIDLTKSDIALLHCVTSYPTPIEQANLSSIPEITKLGVIAGYSDHTLGIEASVLSVALGARIIEKHFTLDHDLIKLSGFRDHELSADPVELKELVEKVRNAEKMMGDPNLAIQVCEEKALEPVRRSICAARDLKAGAQLQETDFICLRPGTGIKPGKEDVLVGKKLLKDLNEGETFTYQDFK